MRLWLALVLFALAVLANHGAAAQGQSEAYDQGAADWRDLQTWVDSQTGDRRAGVDYWAANRNQPNHKTCGDAANDYTTGDKVAFIAGCQEAKRRLDPIDVRRADTRYRAGFSDAAKQLPFQSDAAPAPAATGEECRNRYNAATGQISYGCEPPKPPAAPSATIGADYRAALSTWLERHKRYPEEARQRGEEGRAVLRFRVDRYGRVINYSVVSSTGFADLDSAVEQMMRGATLPPFPPSMPQPEIEVSVTVGFGLQTDAAIPVPQLATSGDPLLDVEHRKVVERASNACNPQIMGVNKPYMCPDGPDALVAKWEANRLAGTVNFRDFILDKEEMAQARIGEYGVGKAIWIRGVYVRAADSMDYLVAPGQISPMAYGRDMDSDTAIPLLIDEKLTDREDRAALLTCREKYPPETFTGCSVLLSGFVQKCTIKMKLTNASHDAICIQVGGVTVDPRS